MNLKLPLLLGCCLFAAITACAETSASLDENAAGKKKADVYITTADRQQSFNHTTQKLSKTPAFESVITLNSKVKFQEIDRKSTRLNCSHNVISRMPSSA